MRNLIRSSKELFFYLVVITLLLATTLQIFPQTAADTQIKNIATVTFTDGSTTYSNSSNEVVITVAKVAGLTITPDAQTDSAVVPGQTGVVKTFRVTNIGNLTDSVVFKANGGSLRVVGEATITAAVVGSTDILTNSSAVTQSLAQNGFVDVTVTLSINSGATLGSTIQLFLGDAATGINFDNITADNSVNEVNTVSTGATNGSREARGDLSFPVSAADLTISKSHSGNFTVGSTGTYSLTITNIGNTPTSGTITVTDSLPAGLTVNGGAANTVTPSGTNAANWTCNSNAASPQVITCTSSTAIANSSSSTFSLTVNVGNNAASSVTNNVSVGGGGETNTTNNTATDPTTIVSTANLGITKNDGPNLGFYPGNTTTYTIVVSNAGPSSANNAVFTDPAVANLTANSVTCTSTTGGAVCPTVANTTVALMQGSGIIIPTLPSGGSVTFSVAATPGNSYQSIVNTATVTPPSGVTDSDTSNNSATDTNVILVSVFMDVSLTKSGPATAQPNSNITYTLTVDNLSGGYGEGSVFPDFYFDIPNVTVEDTLPAGVTFVSASNGGTYNSTTHKVTWNLGTIPAQVIQNLTVVVTTPNEAAVAAGNNSLFNTATVSAPNESDTTNNTGTATTALDIPIDLTIAKTHSGNFNANSTGTYNLTVNNIGAGATSGTITVVDNLPTGLSVNGGAAGAVTLSGANAANWTCNSDAAAPQAITCTSSTVINGNGSSAFSFTVNVANNVAATVINTATVSGGGEPSTKTGNNTATDPTNTNALPNLQLVKSCPSPANCTTAPQLPGTDLTYKIEFTNTGGQSAQNLAIVDRIPDFTDFKLGTATANVGGTGLTFTIEYSSDYDALNPNAATWNYTPTSGGGGASAGYDRNVKAIRWRVTSGMLSNSAPNNIADVSFVTKIR